MKYRKICKMCTGTKKIERIKDFFHVGRVYLGIKVYEKCLFCEHAQVEIDEDLITEHRTIN